MDPRKHLLRNGWITLAASFALAALLALPGRAGAVDYTNTFAYPSVGPIIAAGSLGLTNGSLPGGGQSGTSGQTFLDHFTFTVQPSATFTLTTSLLFQNFVNITGAQLYDGTGFGATLFATTGSPFFTASPVLSPGFYDLRVSGTLTGTSGLYGVAVNFSPAAAPIPEPETYAMMLAGLGLMGFVARRRKQKQAV